MPAPLRVTLVGGGLGGLAAAAFLLRAGVDVQVYEQSPRLREVGAGIVVAPNMVRLLDALGLHESLEACAVRLEAAWEFRRWEDGRVLSAQPMGEACVRMYGTHCYVAHRADLLAMLHGALPPGTAHLGRRCLGVLPQGDDAIALHWSERDGSEHVTETDAVIGADGIHSVLRPYVEPAIDVRFSGLCAFRGLVPAEDAPAFARRAVQTLWLGPGRHFVHYPISSGRLVNLVGIVPAGDWRDESWLAEGTVDDLRAEYAGWDARVLQLIDGVRSTQRWAMYDRSPLPRWSRGRVALLGDAAHAMLPFFAQGAAQALEDAAVLAACLRGVGRDGVAEALARYDAIRRPRASEVQLMSRGREVQNHLPDGPAQAARDETLASAEPLRQSAWLYGHDALAACS